MIAARIRFLRGRLSGSILIPNLPGLEFLEEIFALDGPRALVEELGLVPLGELDVEGLFLGLLLLHQLLEEVLYLTGVLFLVADGLEEFDEDVEVD